MTQEEWICKTEEDTARVAAEIADHHLIYPVILCLEGDLGAGKSAFSRAIIRHLLDDPEMNVPSPTYTLVQTYDDDNIWHFDLYRMEDPQDIYDIGWEEALQARLCLIEWPSRLGTLRPRQSMTIVIDVLSDESRRISLISSAD